MRIHGIILLFVLIATGCTRPESDKSLPNQQSPKTKDTDPAVSNDATKAATATQSSAQSAATQSAPTPTQNATVKTNSPNATVHLGNDYANAPTFVRNPSLRHAKFKVERVGTSEIWAYLDQYGLYWGPRSTRNDTLDAAHDCFSNGGRLPTMGEYRRLFNDLRLDRINGVTYHDDFDSPVNDPESMKTETFTNDYGRVVTFNKYLGLYLALPSAGGARCVYPKDSATYVVPPVYPLREENPVEARFTELARDSKGNPLLMKRKDAELYCEAHSAFLPTKREIIQYALQHSRGGQVVEAVTGDDDERTKMKTKGFEDADRYDFTRARSAVNFYFKLDGYKKASAVGDGRTDYPVWLERDVTAEEMPWTSPNFNYVDGKFTLMDGGWPDYLQAVICIYAK